MSKSGGNAGWLDWLSGLIHRVGAAGRPDAALAGSAASGFGKRALKETIERKRKNDQARREELDRLRQQRRQGPSAAVGASDTGAEAFFQSTVMPYPEAQSLTIRKIDAVEAQMSHHWLKGRVGGAGVGMRPLPSPAWEVTDFEATHLAIALVDPLSPADAWRPLEATGLASEFMTSGLLTIEATAPAPDIELERAALSFANGDLAGAQQVLHTALRASPLRSAEATRRAAALMDLSRTTGQRALFDAVVSEYGRHFERSVPGWFLVPEALAPSTPLAQQGVGATPEWMLRGELRGDMPGTLAELQRPLPAGVPVAVSCAHLVRVDFSAAGSLLTWAMVRQQAGGTVRFDDVPHLVAAFFHVIGINEHAEVVLRTR
ncbi:MAG: STAS domain-containing protein [Betaproteobacteria bacterium]|nr:STAS domain-containing protein [Betaproteobacteria bacterium]